MTGKEFIEWLAHDVKAYRTQGEAAQDYGISSAYLGDILKGKREPGEKLLAAVGFQKVVSYEFKGNPQRFSAFPHKQSTSN